MSMTTLLQDETFKRLCALIGVVSSPLWQSKHPSCKAGFHYNNMLVRVEQYHPDLDAEISQNFYDLVSSAIDADETLKVYFRVSDVSWFLKALHGENEHVENTKTLLLLLFAMSKAEGKFISPVSASDLTGKAESSLRNMASAGQIPGAKMVGKQWLIPMAWVDAINKE